MLHLSGLLGISPGKGFSLLSAMCLYTNNNCLIIVFVCLQDSGGFQMVSLVKLSEMTEEGVKFVSPHDNSVMMLTPEKSIEIQNDIGKYRLRMRHVTALLGVNCHSIMCACLTRNSE